MNITEANEKPEVPNCVENELRITKNELQKITEQYTESQRRERILIRRLGSKEQEILDLASQIAELKSIQACSASISSVMDPAINILFKKFKLELQSTRAKLEETQNELSAWKFTPDSNTGKRLMAKCRLLYQENEDLGKMTSNGRLSILQSDIALQKSFSEEVKKSQSELDDFLQELDEDVEGMQSTIFFLQQELKTAKENISVMEKEKLNLRTVNNSQEDGNDTNEHIESIASAVLPATEDDFEDKHLKKRSYNSDSSGENSMDITKSIKKSRRSSVLSLDLNEEDDIGNEDIDKNLPKLQ